MIRRIRWIPLALVILLVIGFFFLKNEEDETAEHAAAEEKQATMTSFLPTRVHEDRTYEGYPSSKLSTLLLIGYDHMDEGTLDEETRNFNQGGQSDFLLLLVMDHENQRIRQLQINRDTLTDVKFYSNRGSYYGTRRMQICLSHAYGDTQEMNNRNTIWAVENLLGIAGEGDGAQIDGYLSMDITGIDRLNDLLGGIVVPIEDDFSYYDPTMVQGTSMLLNGPQAQIYCRQRYHIGDQSNENRMRRQRIYMDAAILKLKSLVEADKSFAKDVLNGMGLIFDKSRMLDESFGFTLSDDGGTPVTDTPTHYLMTDKSLDSIAGLLLRVMSYEIAELETLPGEHRLGTSGYMEFVTEKNAGLNWALDALYRPLQ